VKIQAIAVNQTGGPEVLRLEERELGDPGPGQVRIRIRAAGVNYIDVYFRTGLYPRPLPFVAGSRDPERSSRWRRRARPGPGDRVAWSAVPGSYATGVLSPAASVVRVPTAWTMQSARPRCSRA